DGGWGSWSPWTECAQICGGSIVERIRVCDNPAPANGGAKCPGPDKETKEDCKEPCEVDGGWGEWSEWTRCSTSCGPGKKTRDRKCNNPEAAYGGKCVGDAQETDSCKLFPCPSK
ncbi:predicted protein, partial [Nematostella vectensis]